MTESRGSQHSTLRRRMRRRGVPSNSYQCKSWAWWWCAAGHCPQQMLEQLSLPGQRLQHRHTFRWGMQPSRSQAAQVLWVKTHLQPCCSTEHLHFQEAPCPLVKMLVTSKLQGLLSCHCLLRLWAECHSGAFSIDIHSPIELKCPIPSSDQIE